MKMTDIRIRKTLTEGKMKAVVSVTVVDQLALHDIRIIEGTDKLFIAMPSRKTPDGNYRDIAHPINSEFRAQLESEILAKYSAELDSQSEPSSDQ